MNAIAVTNGYVGDIALVNGARYPEARAARGWIRLRILNGSNARGYRLGISDGRSFYVIASDGGLLASPVELKELPIYAGERFEMLVDGRDGRAFDVVTLPVAPDIMRLPPFDGPLPLVTIRPDGADGAGRLSSSLAVLPALPRRLPPLSQVLAMNMFRDMRGMMPLQQAGLPGMIQSGKADPAVVARVANLIVGDPALSASKAALLPMAVNLESLSRSSRSIFRRPETRICVGGSPKDATGCRTPCTSTAASSASSRGMASRRNPSVPGGRMSC